MTPYSRDEDSYTLKSMPLNSRPSRNVFARLSVLVLVTNTVPGANGQLLTLDAPGAL